MPDTAKPGAAASASPAPLDDVMLAMDVVDTLRHREHIIDRELSEKAREADLMERLRKIYAAQGIDVPDRILKDGVEALKKSRFVYDPPAPGLQVGLARAYVNRWRWGRYVAIAGLALVVAWAAYTFGYRIPSERRAEAQRIELSETIPGELEQLAVSIRDEARDPDAVERADVLLAAGKSAAAEGRRDAALEARAGLTALRDRLRQTYEIRIVSRPGELSGIWRIPDANPNARNYYLIVEAVDPSGSALSLPVQSEEDDTVRTVEQWGQRVPEEVFDAVRRDKQDDGILQGDVIGAKRSGYLEPDFTTPVAEGTITEW